VSSLDRLLQGINIRDKLERFQYAMRKAGTAALLAATLYTPAPRDISESNYTPSSYGVTDRLYVHTPPWVRVERAPFHEFGPNLFGLAYTSTGLVRIREDLQDLEYLEVKQHEILHQLYPNCSEAEIRGMVRARFGDRAAIHQRIGPGI
jgi:hypothetical protein